MHARAYGRIDLACLEVHRKVVCGANYQLGVSGDAYSEVEDAHMIDMLTIPWKKVAT